MMQETLTKKRIIDFFLDKGILLSSDFVDSLQQDINLDSFYDFLKSKVGEDFLVFNKDVVGLLNTNEKIDLNWKDFEKMKALQENGENPYLYYDFINRQQQKDEKEEVSGEQGTVVMKALYKTKEKKFETKDFVAHFNKRFEALKKLLQNRQELQNTTSINRLSSKAERSKVSIIGIVLEKNETANGNILLSLEDPTGVINVLANKNNPEIYNMGKEIVLDEVIGLTGTLGNKIIFADSILFPDIPINSEMKKSEDEVYAIFLSDIHFGSTKFLHEEFGRFIKWINGELGSEKQQNIAKKVKYVFVVGDMVDGIGVYQGQEKELTIKDISEQYTDAANWLKKIPKDKKIIICPGNHDAMRISEPQPLIDKNYAKDLYTMENVIMVTNPALINIHSSEKFSGIDVLMYHGYSYDHYAANVDSIREKGGYDRADLIMKFLLQRRHLAPTHSSSLYIPDPEKDSLVIETIPDIFVSGHIHKAAVKNYRNVTTISSSCWQAKTSFQEKVGHHPEPARLPIVNLQTREVKIMRFDSPENEGK